MRNNLSVAPNAAAISQGIADSQSDAQKPSVTLQGVLKILDEFRCNAIITAGGFQVSSALGRGASGDSVNEFRNLFSKTVFVELCYGGVGVFVLLSLITYSCLSGRIFREGCGPALKDTVGGNNYLHFLAAVLSCGAGIAGAIGLYEGEVNETYLQLSAILTMFSKTLVTGSQAKQGKKKDSVSAAQQTENGSYVAPFDEVARERVRRHLADDRDSPPNAEVTRRHEPLSDDELQSFDSSGGATPHLFRRAPDADDRSDMGAEHTAIRMPSAEAEGATDLQPR